MVQTAMGEIRDILRRAYQIEVDGYTFYQMAADRASKPAVGELFAKLAHDEVEHKAYLREVAGGLEEKGFGAFGLERPPTTDLKEFVAGVFSDRFREQARGAEMELGALSVGMTLETNAIAFFSGASQKATNRQVKEFYEFLAQWERQHLQALQHLHQTIRQDFWAEAGFAPF